MSIRKTMAAGLVVVSLAACASQPTDGQIYGTAGGAAVGAGIGYAVADSALQGSLVGAAIGALIGYATGTYLDQPVRENTASATVEAAEVAMDGQPVSWRVNERASGSVTPAGAQYKDLGGRVCRDLRQATTLDDVSRQRDVTACRTADGSWEVLDRREREAD